MKPIPLPYLAPEFCAMRPEVIPVTVLGFVAFGHFYLLVEFLN